MRDSYADFTLQGAQIVAIGPDDMTTFQRYWTNENIPYVGLPDPDHKVSRLYRQEVNLFEFSRQLPA